ncbi:hypothetical protein ACH49Y_30310, partial [Nocardia farcinica]
DGDGEWHHVDTARPDWDTGRDESGVPKKFEPRDLPEGVSGWAVNPFQAAVVDPFVDPSGGTPTGAINESFLPTIPGGMPPGDIPSYSLPFADAFYHTMRIILESAKLSGFTWYSDSEHPGRIRPGFKGHPWFRAPRADVQPMVREWNAADRIPDDGNLTRPFLDRQEAARQRWARVQAWADEQYRTFRADDSDITRIADNLADRAAADRIAHARELIDRVRAVLRGDAEVDALVDDLTGALADEGPGDAARLVADLLDVVGRPTDPADHAEVTRLVADQLADRGPTFTAEDIERIKNHLMRDEHLIRDPHDGTLVRRPLDAVADVAEAWHRLLAGEPLPQDILLLQDARAESDFLRDNPIATWRDANQHAISLGYDWNADRPPLTDWRANIPYAPAPVGPQAPPTAGPPASRPESSEGQPGRPPASPAPPDDSASPPHPEAEATRPELPPAPSELPTSRAEPQPTRAERPPTQPAPTPPVPAESAGVSETRPDTALPAAVSDPVEGMPSADDGRASAAPARSRSVVPEETGSPTTESNGGAGRPPSDPPTRGAPDPDEPSEWLRARLAEQEEWNARMRAELAEWAARMRDGAVAREFEGIQRDVDDAFAAIDRRLAEHRAAEQRRTEEFFADLARRAGLPWSTEEPATRPDTEPPPAGADAGRPPGDDAVPNRTDPADDSRPPVPTPDEPSEWLRARLAEQEEWNARMRAELAEWAARMRDGAVAREFEGIQREIDAAFEDIERRLAEQRADERRRNDEFFDELLRRVALPWTPADPATEGQVDPRRRSEDDPDNRAETPTGGEHHTRHDGAHHPERGGHRDDPIDPEDGTDGAAGHPADPPSRPPAAPSAAAPEPVPDHVAPVSEDGRSTGEPAAGDSAERNGPAWSPVGPGQEVAPPSEAVARELRALGERAAAAAARRADIERQLLRQVGELPIDRADLSVEEVVRAAEEHLREARAREDELRDGWDVALDEVDGHQRAVAGAALLADRAGRVVEAIRAAMRERAEAIRAEHDARMTAGVLAARAVLDAEGVRMIGEGVGLSPDGRRVLIASPLADPGVLLPPETRALLARNNVEIDYRLVEVDGAGRITATPIAPPRTPETPAWGTPESTAEAPPSREPDEHRSRLREQLDGLRERRAEAADRAERLRDEIADLARSTADDPTTDAATTEADVVARRVRDLAEAEAEVARLDEMLDYLRAAATPDADHEALLREQARLTSEREFWRAKRDDRADRLGLADPDRELGPDRLEPTLQRLLGEVVGSRETAGTGEELPGRTSELVGSAELSRRRERIFRLQDAAERFIAASDALAEVDRRIAALEAARGLPDRSRAAEVAAQLERLGRERAGQVLALKPWRVMRDDIAARLRVDPDRLGPEDLTATLDEVAGRQVRADELELRARNLELLAEAADQVNRRENEIGRLQDRMAELAGADREIFDTAGARGITDRVGLVDGPNPRIVVVGPRGRWDAPFADHDAALADALRHSAAVAQAMVRPETTIEYRQIVADRDGTWQPVDLPSPRREFVDAPPRNGGPGIHLTRWRDGAGEWHEVNTSRPDWSTGRDESGVPKKFEPRDLPEGVSGWAVNPFQAA